MYSVTGQNADNTEGVVNMLPVFSARCLLLLWENFVCYIAKTFVYMAKRTDIFELSLGALRVANAQACNNLKL